MKVYKEYLVKYEIGTDWHNPHNTTTYNSYTDVIEAESAKEAVQKVHRTYNFSNPNKHLEILSVKSI